MHAKTKRLLRGVGWGVCGLCTVLALYRTLSAPGPTPPPRRLTAEERVQVGNLCAAEEPGWRRHTRQRFPGDAWSQDDDFHASERGWAFRMAASARVPVTDVFRAIDEELHRQPVRPPRKATASPSKPRAFYD